MHHPKHIPFKGGRGGIEIGLKPINEGNWLEIDHLFEAELKLKKALLQDKKDVVLVSNNDYLDTERELLELIIDFLKIYPIIEFLRDSIGELWMIQLYFNRSIVKL